MKLSIPENLSRVGLRPPCETPAPISVTRPSRMSPSMMREMVGALSPLRFARSAREIPSLSLTRLMTLTLLSSLMSLAFPARVCVFR